MERITHLPITFGPAVRSRAAGDPAAEDLLGIPGFLKREE